MPTAHDEVEITYDADPSFVLPLAVLRRLEHGAPGEPSLGPEPLELVTAEHRLGAVYFDTADLHLARAGLTLRRRTGGPDAGWHLKLPARADTRTEVRMPLGRAVRTVPAPLRRMVRARSGGLTLVPVAQVDTVRTAHRLVGRGGAVLVELADDRVTGRRLAAPAAPGTAQEVLAWREIEVELVDGERGVLDAIDAELRRSGLRRTTATSKLARVLGDLLGSPERARAGRARPQTTSSPADRVVLAHLASLAEQVRAQDAAVRLGAPDAVHEMRVATRRLRSTLSTFDRLLDPERTRSLGVELRWLGAELGVARDAEVLRARIAAAPSGPGGDSVAAQLDARLARDHAAALRQVAAALDSERYHLLLAGIDALVEHPPWTARAGRPSRRELPKAVRQQYRAVRRVMHAAQAAPDGVERDELLHEARKAAKRARYAAEAVRQVFGRPAARFGAAMADLQGVLGEHQDALVLRARLSELAEETTEPAVAFALGRHHARAELEAAATPPLRSRAWKRARRASLSRWLR